MRGRAFFGSSKLMLPGAVIGAVYGPGFSEDLSSWRLVIDDEGNLFQEIDVWQWTTESVHIQEHRREHVVIGPDAVLQLLLEAQRLEFTSYDDSYDPSITDQPDRIISVRFGEIDKTVHAYAAFGLAAEGNRDMIGFLELWEAIHRYAPFPGR